MDSNNNVCESGIMAGTPIRPGREQFILGYGACALAGKPAIVLLDDAARPAERAMAAAWEAGARALGWGRP